MSSEPKKEAVEKKPEDSKPTNDKTTEKPAATKPAPKKVPPKEEPELPAFEKGIADKIIENFGEKTTISFVKPDRVGIKVGRDAVHDVAEFARDVLNYDHVDSVSGVDYPADKEIEVVYHLSSYTDPTLSRQILELATRAQREDKPIPGNDATRLPSLRDIFYSVEFHEREVFEMLGVYFEGHPDNRRLLLPEDWADLPPLRKDFRNKGR
ncbi:MAG: NADH-quinone oxidoreductase subunit C [Nitrosopumilus sp.]|jgi:NADH-quinone oxidoreductase subunit C|nr:NADH-quinone oxidoreductase subunit C [Nitrosopumilus sp.]